MKILVTGSSGHLGEAIVRKLKSTGQSVVGADITGSPHTDFVGSIADRSFVSACAVGIGAVIHTATLHKPHIVTHSRQDFVDTNITGTLNLLEECNTDPVKKLIFTSTTSVYGYALVPPPGEPAAWITEDVVPVPKNIYGMTKLAAENLCQLFSTKFGVPVLVLRTSRFFPEEDDNKELRDAYEDENTKANEFLFRRVDLDDAAEAHLHGLERVQEVGFGRYIISATTPFTTNDLARLRFDAPSVLKQHVPGFEAEYRRRNWNMFPTIDRVYVNEKARNQLGWRPKFNFADVLRRIKSGATVLSPLARDIGVKGYHSKIYADGPYPVD